MLDLTLEKLNQPDFLSQLQKEWEDVLFHLDTVAAAKTESQLSSLLKQAPMLSEQLKNGYNDLLIRFQFVALPHLEINQVIDLLKNNLLLSFTLKDFDLLDQLKAFLQLFDPWTRDEPKKQLLDALRNNAERISSWEKGAQITIKNWLSDYDRELGTGLIDNIKQLSFLARRLTNVPSSEQTILRKIFQIYEYLKITSKDLKNFDNEFIFTDDSGNILAPRDGQLVKIYDVSKNKNIRSAQISEPVVSDNQLTKVAVAPVPPLTPPPPLSPPQPPPQPLPSKDIEEDLKGDLEKALASAPPVATPPAGQLDYSSAIGRVINQLNLNFPDEVSKNRFQNILTSYLKGIRKEMEVRETLARPQKLGGMEYEPNKIDAILKVLREIKTQMTPEVKKPLAPKPALAEGLVSPAEIITPSSPEPEKLLTEPEDVLLNAPSKIEATQEKFSSGPLSPPLKEISIPPSFVSQPSEALPPSAEEKVFNLEVPPELKTEEPVSEAAAPLPSKEITPEINLGEQIPDLLSSFGVEPEALAKAPEPVLPKIEPIKTAQPQPETTVQNVYHSAGGDLTKPKIEEIKVTPKIYGPVDELRTITLEDWRRWGSTQKSAKRILDKINLLAEESFVKKSQGVAAWKESEINKLYLDIGTEAIDNGLSVEQAILKRQNDHRPTLTIEEFNAVAELNQKLRF